MKILGAIVVAPEESLRRFHISGNDFIQSKDNPLQFIYFDEKHEFQISFELKQESNHFIHTPLELIGGIEILAKALILEESPTRYYKLKETNPSIEIETFQTQALKPLVGD